jgi:hypothetical protein
MIKAKFEALKTKAASKADVKRKTKIGDEV